MSEHLGVAFALAAALCFGLQALLVQRGMAAERSAFGGAFLSIVVSAVLFWLLAVGTGLPTDLMTVRALLPFVVAGVAYPAMFRLLYFEGIDRVGPSLASAIIAANPAVAAVLAVSLLGERATLPTVVGLVLVVVGGATLQFAHGSSGDDETDTAGDGDPADAGADDGGDLLVRKLRTASPRDFLYPLGAMAIYGMASVLIKHGLNGFPSPPTATAVTQTSALVVFVAMIGLSGSARSAAVVRDRRARRYFVVAGVFVALAWLGQFFALQIGTVVTVVPLVNVYPLVVVVVSYALARELPRSPSVVAGVLTIVAGASILQL